MRIYLYPEKTYDVSVVIPMYNAEKYIGECLDSLLLQTFKDFEVIVVDDCSTDNSVNIVEDYAPKFNGRLKLTKTERQSGGGGYVPRNMGLNLAQGEYVQFLDADDFLLGSALETLYNAAKEYNADVVYTGAYYRINQPDDVFLFKDTWNKKLFQENLEDKTELTVDNPNENLRRLLFGKGEGNFHASWSKFVRRNFLIENGFFFPEIPNAGDFIWVIKIYCRANRFLRITTPLYFYRRYDTDTVLRKVRQPQEQLVYWFSSFSDFVENLRKVEKENEILSENPEYCLMAFKSHFEHCLFRTTEARNKLDVQAVYKVLHSEFLKKSSDSTMALLPFLFSFIVGKMKINSDAETLIRLKRYITARINLKLTPETRTGDDFQIISVSDEKAAVKKSGWLPENEIGYFVQSYVGKLKIFAKANANGKFQLSLLGLDVHDPENKSKRIPFWIDYTKLIVNGKNIFNKPMPTWHDKPYRYNLNVKAGDEIKIETEWLPHRSDVPAVATPKEELPPKKIEAPKVAPPPKKVVEPIVKKVVESVDKKLLPYFTARVDVNLVTAAGGDFQVVSVSDDNAVVRKANWLPKNEIGYVIQSHKGNMAIVAKATTEGKLTLSLRSMDVRNPKDNTRIPYWIDYTRLTVNAEKLFDEVTPVWHDKPYKFTLNVKAGDEIKIETEWQPHKSDT